MRLKRIIELFETGNVCVCGLKGRGKDMLMANVTQRRKIPYVSNVDYGGVHYPFVPLAYAVTDYEVAGKICYYGKDGIVYSFLEYVPDGYVLEIICASNGVQVSIGCNGKYIATEFYPYDGRITKITGTVVIGDDVEVFELEPDLQKVINPIEDFCTFKIEINGSSPSAGSGLGTPGFSGSTSVLYADFVAFGTFVTSVLGGFLAFEIAPGLSFNGMFSFFLVLGIALFLIKVFS